MKVTHEPATPAPTPKTATKPKPAPLSAEEFARLLTRWDVVLAVIVVIGAFMLASFPARNADLYMDLATGRLIATGGYSFGSDPFSYDKDTGWVNHSWLYDLLLYGVARLTGGSEDAPGSFMLVVIKALVIAWLAWILMSIRRRGAYSWLPIVFTALAVLAMSRGFLLRPFVASLLFTGLTLYLLTREGKPTPRSGDNWRHTIFTCSPARLWALLPLFWLWANLDEWFLVGPLLVGLFLLGELFQQTFANLLGDDDAPLLGEVKTLSMVLVAGLAVCVLNPNHFRVFRLPAQLFHSGDASVLAADSKFAQSLFVSPFSVDDYLSTHWSTAAGMAYIILVVAGLTAILGLTVTAFTTDGKCIRWWRFAIFLPMLAASFVDATLIPLFAVVAGPLTVLNFQDFSARYFGTISATTALSQRRAFLGRALLLVAGIVMLLAAWPGWLNAETDQRRVGWTVAVEPSLRKASLHLKKLHDEKLLPENAKGFNVSQDLACYLAWYCPEEKGWLDHRLGLSRPTTESVVSIWKGFSKSWDPKKDAEERKKAKAEGASPVPVPPTGPTEPPWLQFFRQKGITHIMVSAPDPSDTILAGGTKMLADPAQFVLLYLDGRTMIFGWKDGLKPGNTFARCRLDQERRAFGPDADKIAPPRINVHEPPSWFQRYLTDGAATPLQAHEALLQTSYFSERGSLSNRRKPWIFVGGIAGYAPTHDCISSMVFSFCAEEVVRSSDSGPPDAALLAVRAARRAVAESPQSAAAQLGLAQACSVLAFQEEHWAGAHLTAAPKIDVIRRAIEDKRFDSRYLPWIKRTNLSSRRLLRQVQIVTALKRALALAPPDSQEAKVAERDLYRLFEHMGYWDLAIEHFQKWTEKAEAAGPNKFEKRDDFNKRIMVQRNDLREEEKKLGDLKDLCEKQISTHKPIQQAKMAFRPFCLPGKAAEILEGINRVEENKDLEGALLYLDLMYTTGEGPAVLQELKSNRDRWEAKLGKKMYAWYVCLGEAANGDYDEAGFRIAEMGPDVGPELEKAIWDLVLVVLQGRTFGQFQEHPLCRFITFDMMQRQYSLGLENLDLNLQQLQYKEELQVLDGLLMLEKGDKDSARTIFVKSVNRQGLRSPFEARPIARRYLELIDAANKTESASEK